MGGWEIEGKQKHAGKMKNKPAWPHPALLYSINCLNFQVASGWFVGGLVRTQLHGTERSLLKSRAFITYSCSQKVLRPVKVDGSEKLGQFEEHRFPQSLPSVFNRGHYEENLQSPSSCGNFLCCHVHLVDWGAHRNNFESLENGQTRH